MSKTGKIIVFIIVALFLMVLATVMKEAGAGAVLSVAGTAIIVLYYAMFKKSDDNGDSGNSDSDITLNK
jgi:uncharacterized membrane protein